MLLFFLYSGKLSFPVQNSACVAEEARRVFYRELELVKAHRIEIVGNSLTFTGGFFRIASGNNLLLPIDKGRIVIQTSDETVVVRFRISFLQMMIVSSLLILTMYLVAASRGTNIPLAFCIFWWFWLAGGNIVIFIIRFRGFIKRCMRKAIEIPQEKTQMN